MTKKKRKLEEVVARDVAMEVEVGGREKADPPFSRNRRSERQLFALPFSPFPLCRCTPWHAP